MKRRKRRQDTSSSVAHEIYQGIGSAASDLGHSEHGYGLEGDIAADEIYEDADFMKDMVADRIIEVYWDSKKDPAFVLAVLADLTDLFGHLPKGTFDSLKREYEEKLKSAKTAAYGEASDIAYEISSAIESAVSEMAHSEHGYNLKGDIAADALYENSKLIAELVGDRVHWCCSQNPELALAVLTEVEQLLDHLPTGTFNRTKKHFTRQLEKSRGASATMRRRFAGSPERRMWDLEQELAILDGDFDHEVHQVCPNLLNRTDTSESLEGYLDFVHDAEQALKGLLRIVHDIKKNANEQQQLVQQLERR